jgi:2-iminobutanoate/2-iminopropanoate deaminase
MKNARSSVTVLLALVACRAAEPAPSPAPPAAARASTVYFDAPGALGPYSAAVRSSDLVFFSGRIGATKASFEEEVETTIGALEVELRRAGLELADVLSCTVYLTDMERYADFNAVYAKKFAKPYPARTCVAVTALPAGAHVELQAVARAR